LKKYFIAVILILAVSTAFAAKSAEEIYYSKCSGCHSSGLALKKKKSAKDWESTIKRMKKHGLSISSSETASIVKFLTGGE